MVKAENSGGEAQSIADFLVLESQPDRMVEITKTLVFSDLPQEPVKVSFHNFIYQFKSLFTFYFYPNLLIINYDNKISLIRLPIKMECLKKIIRHTKKVELKLN